MLTCLVLTKAMSGYLPDLTKIIGSKCTELLFHVFRFFQVFVIFIILFTLVIQLCVWDMLYDGRWNL